jgi:serine/threonine-protein kinase
MLQAVRWVEAMLGALGAAHHAGVVHRDLKPENIFIEGPGEREGLVRLLDFGIARDLEGPRTATMAGQALGTVYYMAPEQARDASSVTVRADVYAVGVILYQILTGTFPYDGDNPHAVVIRAQMDEHEAVSVRAPWLDPRVAALVESCLRRRPEERPAEAVVLGAALAGLLADPEVAGGLASRRVQPSSFCASPAPSQNFEDPFANFTPKDQAPGPAPEGKLSRPASQETLEPPETPVPSPEASEGISLRRSIAIVAAIVPVVVVLVLLGAQALHRGSSRETLRAAAPSTANPAPQVVPPQSSARTLAPLAPEVVPEAPVVAVPSSVPAAPREIVRPRTIARSPGATRGPTAAPAQAASVPLAVAPAPVAPPPAPPAAAPVVAAPVVAAPVVAAPVVAAPPSAPTTPRTPPVAPSAPRPPAPRPPEGEGPTPFTTF